MNDRSTSPPPGPAPPVTRSLLNSGEVMDEGQLSVQRSPENTHDTMNGPHQGLQRGDTSATMISKSGGGEVGGEETTENGNNTSGAGNRATGGGGNGGLEREAMASLPAADLPNGSSKSAIESAAAAVAATDAAGDGNNRKGRGDGRTLKNTAARLATVISETSMVRPFTIPKLECVRCSTLHAVAYVQAYHEEERLHFYREAR